MHATARQLVRLQGSVKLYLRLRLESYGLSSIGELDAFEDDFPQTVRLMASSAVRHSVESRQRSSMQELVSD